MSTERLREIADDASVVLANAIRVNDDLHVELADGLVRKHWPDATSWTRRWEAWDDMPGGQWILACVADDSTEDSVWLYQCDIDSGSDDERVEAVDDVLAQIHTLGDGHGDEYTRAIVRK